MKNPAWYVIGAVVVIVIALVSIHAQPAPMPQEGEIRLAAVLGLTGYAAEDSLNAKRGIDLAVADLAQQGIRVDVTYEDDKTDPKQTVSAVRYLADNVHPLAIIGPIWSFLEAAATPVLTADKLVNYSPANTSEFTPGGPYDFHGAVKNAAIIPVAAKWLEQHGIHKVAIIVSRDAWGASVGTAFGDAASQAGATVVLDESILSGGDTAATMSADVTKAKGLGAQAVLFTGYDEEAVALVKRSTDLGFDEPILAATREYQKLLSAGTVNPTQLKNVDFLSAQNSPEFAQKFKKAYGVEPGNYSDRAYDGVMMIVQAIRNASSTDADSISQYLRSHPYTGYGGVYEFDAKGDITGGVWQILPVIR